MRKWIGIFGSRDQLAVHGAETLMPGIISGPGRESFLLLPIQLASLAHQDRVLNEIAAHRKRGD